MGAELAQEDDFSVTFTQENFTKNLGFLPIPPELRAGRRGPLSEEETQIRPCKQGELCLLATVSRPDIRARLVTIASRR